MKQYDTFIFENFSLDAESKSLSLNYSLDGSVFFTENFVFDFEWRTNIDQESLQKALFGLWIACGISYFKTCLPPHIRLANFSLHKDQKMFFETLYQEGLGEFFYRNNIDPTNKVSFPHDEKAQNKFGTLSQIPSNGNLSGNLVLLGGGKDSLTTLEILKKQNVDFETLTVGDYPFFTPMIQKIGKHHLTVHRTLSQRLFDLNEKGSLNGHVPISAILAFVSVVVGLLRGHQNIILSNESSANDPNITLDSGKTVNHQYSKSMAFERSFQQYVRHFIHPRLHYFSFLRPLSELKIADIFCHSFFDHYKTSFSSCNRNFQTANTRSSFFWCGECPKCAFVFLLFSPFLSRKELNGLFGKNLLAEKSLQPVFQELLGHQGCKPFECVGNAQEVQQAVFLASQKKDYEDFRSLGVSNPHYDWEKLAEHSMPEHFYTLLQNFLDA